MRQPRATAAELRPVLLARVIILIAMASSAASGIWFSGFIGLPDSLHTGGRPWLVLSSPADGRVYVAGDESDRLLVFDSTGLQPMASIQVDPSLSALCLDSATNTIYCASAITDSIAVVDGQRQRLMRRFWAGNERPVSLIFNPQANKLYCGTFYGTIAVIDAQTGHVIRRLPSPASPSLLDYDPVTNRVYCGSTYTDTVLVIDGTLDSVIARIGLNGGDVRGLSLNPCDGLLYAIDDGTRVSIIDPATSTVVDSIPVGANTLAFCVNTRRNQLYVSCSNNPGPQFVVVDCATRSVVSRLRQNAGGYALCYDDDDDKVFSSNAFDNTVTVITCSSGAMRWDPTGAFPRALCYNPSGGRVFVASYDGRSVTIIDGASGLPLASPPTAGASMPGSMCWDDLDGRLYVACAQPPSVAVIDGVTRAPVASMPVSYAPSNLTYYPPRNKVYGTGSTGGAIYAIDCATNSVSALSVGGEPCAVSCVPTHDKVYFADRAHNSVLVLSCSLNTVVTRIPVESPSYLCYNPVMDRLYCTDGSENGIVSVVDCSQDQVIHVDTALYHPGEMEFDSSLNVVCMKLSSSRVLFYDCATDSIVRSEALPLCEASHDAMALRSATHHLTVGTMRHERTEWTAGYATLDVASRTILNQQDLLSGYMGMIDEPQVFCDPVGRFYWASEGTVRDLSAGGRVDFGAPTDWFAWNPTGEVLYAACPAASCIAAIGVGSRPTIEEPSTTFVPSRRLPTVFAHGSLRASNDASRLLNASGRLTMPLRAGTNDISQLPPGVYFLQKSGDSPSSKVIVCR